MLGRVSPVCRIASVKSLDRSNVGAIKYLRGGVKMEEIKRFQNVLLLVRRLIGWTSQEFAEKIGVTRQTINNLERKKNKLTKLQYIAMRSVIDAEISKSPKEETEMLRYILDAFVDNPEKYSEEEKKVMLDNAKLLSPSILAGESSRKDVSMLWISILKGFVAGAIAGIVMGLSDIDKEMEKDLNEERGWIYKVSEKK